MLCNTCKQQLTRFETPIVAFCRVARLFSPPHGFRIKRKEVVAGRTAYRKKVLSVSISNRKEEVFMHPKTFRMRNKHMNIKLSSIDIPPSLVLVDSF